MVQKEKKISAEKQKKGAEITPAKGKKSSAGGAAPSKASPDGGSTNETTDEKPDVIAAGGVVYLLSPGMQIFVKTADLCAMTGKSNQWIGQLTSQGTIHKSKTSHGSLYDLSASIRAYCQALEERADKREAMGLDPKVERDRQKNEAHIKKAKAIIAMAEAAELQGKMHRSEDVASMTEDLIYTIRGAMMALPGRLAVDVAKARDAAEAAEMIRVEVHRAMEELASYHYDPEKYRERVHERRNWETVKDGAWGEDDPE